MDTVFPNVSDPTDFPPHAIAPGLQNVDASLRCTICGELFDGPITLPCGHCFCSVCVRIAMAEKQECPCCRKATNEGHIRPNPAMEDVVTAWRLSRPYVLQMIEDSKGTSPVSNPVTPKLKRRKLSPPDGNSRTLASASHSPSKTLKRRRKTSEEYGDTIPTSDADEDEMCSGTVVKPDSSTVNCPICNTVVKLQNINEHMDKNCLKPSEGSEKSSTASKWGKIMAKGIKGKEKDNEGFEDEKFPLPKVSYDTIKEKKLREMLAEHKLPITGDRTLLVKRHQQWVMMYNANLDKSSSNQKSKPELRKTLKKWEDERSKTKKLVVEDLVAHEKRHKDQFANLIDAARKNKTSFKAQHPSPNSHSNELLKLPLRSGPVQSTRSPFFHNEDSAIVVDSQEE